MSRKGQLVGSEAAGVGEIPRPSLGPVLALRQAGRLTEAAEACVAMLQDSPEHPDVLHLLGLIRLQLGQADEAVRLMSEVLRERPTSHEVHNNLGSAYRAQGRRAEAIASYRKAIGLKPDFPEAHNNLGSILFEEGRLEEAAECLQQAIRLRPDFTDAYNTLGGVLAAQADLETPGEESWSDRYPAPATLPGGQDPAPSPSFPITTLDRARRCFEFAIHLDPDCAQAYNNLGNLLYNRNQDYDRMVRYYETALKLNPDLPEALTNLADVLRDHGDAARATECYDKAIRAGAGRGVLVKRATILPVIPKSTEDIRIARESFEERIEALLRNPPTLADPHREAGSLPFYLAYHGKNDLSLQSKLARLYLKSCPTLGYVAGGLLQDRTRISSGKIRIGFISRFFGQNSVSAKSLAHLFRGLSRVCFSPVWLCFKEASEEIFSHFRQPGDRIVHLPSHLDSARKRIEQEEFDILHYLDLGADSLTYFLAFARLAPIQCTGWGHGMTSALPNMDCFISSKLAEPTYAQDNYSERLHLFEALPTCYSFRAPAPLEGDRPLRSSTSNRIYLCVQSLFKIHPDFDSLLGDILKTDPNGSVVLIEGHQSSWTRLMKARLARRLGEAADRIQFVERRSESGLLDLMRTADVILDTPHFSGGITSAEALGLGVPVVTLPGDFLRGRLTFALYRSMGFLECVARDPSDYVRLAVRLAVDRPYREDVRKEILDRNHVLFEGTDRAVEYERFFTSAVEELWSEKESIW